jgi:acyl-CoA dehydrogenase
MKPLGVLRGTDLTTRIAAAVAVASEFADEVDRDGRFPAEAIQALRLNQLLNIAVPVELGGEGLSFADVVAICSALGGACASTAMVYAMHQISLGNLIDCAADSAWHRAYIGQAAREQLLFASATTEAGVGGDLRHSLCAIEMQGDRYRLAKEASVISYGEYADAVFITARRDPEAPSSDQVLTVACKGQYVAERLSDWDTMGMRGTCSHGWRLAVDAPAEQILPKPFADIAAESMVAISHLLWSAVWIGIASDALARAQAFVTADARRHPGVASAGAPRLAAAFSTLVANEALIAQVATTCDAFRSDPARTPTLSFALSVNALKVNASTAALAVVEDCMMICGLQGYKNGTPYSVGRHLRDIHSARLMIGNDRILANTGQMMLLRRSPVAARALS